MERGFNACQTPRSIPSIFNRFPLIQPVSSNVRHFSTFLAHFGFPGYAPGTIAINVTRMERGFNACKMPRCIYPSIFNHFWDIASYWSKIATFSYPPLVNAPARGDPVGISWRCLMLVKQDDWATIWWKNYDDILNRFHTIPACHGQTDGQTDRRTELLYQYRDKNCYNYNGTLALIRTHTPPRKWGICFSFVRNVKLVHNIETRFVTKIVGIVRRIVVALCYNLQIGKEEKSWIYLIMQIPCLEAYTPLKNFINIHNFFE